MKKFMSGTAALMLAAVMTVNGAAEVSALSYGWQGAPGASAYYMVNDSYATGLMVIDGVTYRFSQDGSCLGTYTGFGVKNQRRRYYQNGVVFGGGWLTLPSGTYYCYSDGSLAEGIANIDGKQYNFTAEGKLITSSSKDAFTVTADKNTVYLGKGDSISFTVTANNISNAAAIQDNISIHRYENGQWYSVKPDMLSIYSIGDSMNTLNYIGTVGDPPVYRSSHTILFCPEDYSSSLRSGRYRAAINILTEKGVTTKYCEFDIVESVIASTPSSVYYINTTDKINFSAALNSDAMVYGPEIYDLYFYDTSKKKWVRIDPSSGKDVITNPHFAAKGTVVNSYLDLTRYNRASMKSGNYLVVLGDGINCNFELRAPFESEITEVELSSKRVRQVKITISNRTDQDMTIKGYGELLKYQNGKWVKVTLKKNAKLNTEMTIPALYKQSKGMVLTDYYSYSDLTKGSYCMKIPASNGGYVYAYFKLS